MTTEALGEQFTADVLISCRGCQVSQAPRDWVLVRSAKPAVVVQHLTRKAATYCWEEGVDYDHISPAALRDQYPKYADDGLGFTTAYLLLSRDAFIAFATKVYVQMNLNRVPLAPRVLLDARLFRD